MIGYGAKGDRIWGHVLFEVIRRGAKGDGIWGKGDKIWGFGMVMISALIIKGKMW